MELGSDGSSVMGPEGSNVAASFTDKIPPSFNGHTRYELYRQDVELWLCLTNLDVNKQGPAIIGRLAGEPKSSAKSLGTATIAGPDGAHKILEHLDRSYAVDDTDQLDLDLAGFLDYCWDSKFNVETFIAGFHARVDKLAELNLNTKLQGHLLLRQAGLNPQSKNMIVGAASGSYEIRSISGAMRQAFRNNSAPGSTMFESVKSTANQDIIVLFCYYCKKKGHTKKDCRKLLAKNQTSAIGVGPSKGNKNETPTFYTYATTSEDTTTRALVDTGACGSIVGQDTLNAAMRTLGIASLDNGSIKRNTHRFGDGSKEYKTVTAIVMPFACNTIDNKEVKFKIGFDVIEGNLPFLVGMPALESMQSWINCKSKILGLWISGECFRIQLHQEGTHLFIPLSASSASYYTPSYPERYTAAACPIFTTQYHLRPNTPDTKSLPTPEEHCYTLPTSESGLHHVSDADSNSHSRFLIGNSYPGPESSPCFDPHDLKKLHLQLKHGSFSEMKTWLKAANKWTADIGENIQELIMDCTCGDAEYPVPHPKVSTTPPTRKPQEEVAIDVVFMEGVPCLHIVDKCTRWSETAVLSRRSMQVQITAFQNAQVLRHGSPLVIYGDNEYNNADFKGFCKRICSKFIPVAANDHQANGAVESGNRTLKTYFRRIRSEDQKSSVASILAEATYGKNVCVGNKGASAFQLLYGRSPNIMSRTDIPAPSLTDHQANIANNRISKMLRSQVRCHTDIVPGDFVYFWRDQHRWIGPARVIALQGTTVTLMHNEMTKTSDLSRVRKTVAPFELLHLDSDTDQTEEIDEMAMNVANSDNMEHGGNGDENNSSSSTPQAQHPAVNRADRVVTRSQTRNAHADAQLDRRLPWIPVNSSESNYSYASFSSRKPSAKEKSDAYRRERMNWQTQNAMIPVHRSRVPRGANIVRSHVVYNVKSDDTVKARIVPRGDLDAEREYLRTDLPCMNLDVFRLILSISAQNRWQIGEMDITAAFLQAQGLSRVVYVLPPPEEDDTGSLWRLTAAAYGLADSGRLWYITSDTALVDSFGLTKSRYESALYFRKDAQDRLNFLVTCQVDNYIYGGTTEEIHRFEHLLKSAFEVGELKRGTFDVYGSEIRQDQRMAIIVTQKKKMDNLSHLPIQNSEKKDGNLPAAPSDIRNFSACVGYMLFMARVSHPLMAFYASDQASKSHRLRNHHLKSMNAHIKYLRSTDPQLLYRPGNAVAECVLEVYSDASLPGKGETASRSGWVILKRHGSVVHPIAWQSRKIRRVATSSSAAETLAAASALDTALYLMDLMQELGITTTVSLTTDSRSLFALATTTKEPQEKRLKIDIASIREEFDSGNISCIRWSPGHYLIADALTKINKDSSSHLMKVFRTGSYDSHPDSETRFSPKGEVRTTYHGASSNYATIHNGPSSCHATIHHGASSCCQTLCHEECRKYQ